MRRLISSLLVAAPLSGYALNAADSVQLHTIDSLRRTIECQRMVIDSLQSLNVDTMEKQISRYERNKLKRRQFWASLTPDYMRFQMWGSVGLLNLGVGWAYGKHDILETDVMFGYVPKYEKTYAFATFTVRQTYVPWTCNLYGAKRLDAYSKGAFTWQPLSCGMYVNTVLRSDYWQNEPNKYPENGYYRFSTKLRFGIFVGQRYTYHIPEAKRYFFKNLSFVWELSSCDLYIVNKAINDYIPFKDILSLSLGLKADF